MQRNLMILRYAIGPITDAKARSMDFDTFENMIACMRTDRISRKTALRGLLGGAAVVLTAGGIATSDVEADNKPGKAGKRHKARKPGKRHKGRKRGERGNTSCTTETTDESASVPASDELAPGQIIIEDPCEAFPETCCSDS